MRILFMAEAVTLAHVARPLVLAGGLHVHGHEVHFAADVHYDSVLGELPFQRHALHSIACAQFMDALSKGRPVYDLPTLRRYVDDDLVLLRAIRPDVVIGDFRLSLAVSATLATIPYWTITSPYWSPYARVRFPVPEHVTTRLFGVRLAQSLFDLTHRLVFAGHALPMHRLRRLYGLPSLGFDLRRVYTQADHVCYADIEGMVAMAPLPANHHWLGPITWSPGDRPDTGWRQFVEGAEEPVIYVTLGSSGSVAKGAEIVQALGALPARVLVATAGRLQCASVPKNCFLSDFLPGDEVMSVASMMICNGGSPSTQQALRAGIPVLGIPSNLDQHLNMQAVVARGAGLCLRSEQLTVPRLGTAVRGLLVDESLRVQARALSRRYRATDAGEVLQGLLAQSPTGWVAGE